MLLKIEIKNEYFNQAAILLFFLEYDFNMQLRNVNIHIYSTIPIERDARGPQNACAL